METTLWYVLGLQSIFNLNTQRRSASRLHSLAYSRHCISRLFNSKLFLKLRLYEGKEKKAITEQSIKQTNLTPRNLNEAIAHMDNSQIGVEAANTSHLIKDLSNLEDLNEANLVN